MVVPRVRDAGSTLLKISPGKGTIVLQLIDPKADIEMKSGNPVRSKCVSHALSFTRQHVPRLPCLSGTNYRWSR